jgi:hypothetical protein
MKLGARVLLVALLVAGPRVVAQEGFSPAMRAGLATPLPLRDVASASGVMHGPSRAEYPSWTACEASMESEGAADMSFNELEGEETFAPDSVQTDSVRQAMTRRLLPEHLSLMERSLWGESGVLRTTGIAGPLTPESRKNELAVRRGMLTVHQIGGLVTLGLMGTTVYFGQMALDHPQTRSYRNTHGNFVSATIISYSLTGALAILSPPPLIRRDEVSTTSIHKTLAWVHVAGMILTPILGASLRHSMNDDQLARFHQISGYVTTATFAAAMVVITF